MSRISMRATCPTDFIFLYLLTLSILDIELRAADSLLCRFLSPPVTFSFLDPFLPLRILFAVMLNLCSSLGKVIVKKQFKNACTHSNGKQIILPLERLKNLISNTILRIAT